MWRLDLWLWFCPGGWAVGVGPPGVHICLPKRKSLGQVAERAPGEDPNAQDLGVRVALGPRHFCIYRRGSER